MPKTSSRQLEQDEKRVLDILQIDAKASIDAIAKQCGFSRQKVWRIIKKFEKDGAIWGYTAVTDDDYTNMVQFTMLMKRTTRPVDDKIRKEMVTIALEDLLPGKIKMDNIEYVHGCYDGVVTFKADSVITAKQFCERFKQHFQGYYQEIELLQPIIVYRRHGLRNPKIKEDIKYL